jgi:hypothetical protein
MRAALGRFAQREIEAALGPDLIAGVQTALRHYAGRLTSGPAPVGLPELALAGGGARRDLELAVGHEVERALEREGDRQGASLGQLTTHAVFVYLADLERSSGEDGSDPWNSVP